jgi:nucleoside-diphosphate-sugar epimerase
MRRVGPLHIAGVNSADVDINGIIKLLDYSQFTGVEKFVYASSGCAIYGSYGKMPLKEDFISVRFEHSNIYLIFLF